MSMIRGEIFQMKDSFIEKKNHEQNSENPKYKKESYSGQSLPSIDPNQMWMKDTNTNGINIFPKCQRYSFPTE